MPTPLNRSARNRRLAPANRHLPLTLGLFSILAGCSTVDRMKVSSIPMDDYRNRHPIVLAEQTRQLDIFPAPDIRGLDRRTAAQVVQFGRLYRNTGEGPITILVPTDPRVAPSPAQIEGIRHALAYGGGTTALQISSYPVVNRDLASPVRLTFVGLKSKIADQCGQWPSDLASGSSTEGWENKPYWNFGCSTQNMIAEQVADPRDLVGPRAEDPADTVMRDRAISDVRKGVDPTTDWKTKNTSISTVGSY